MSSSCGVVSDGAVTSCGDWARETISARVLSPLLGHHTTGRTFGTIVLGVKANKKRKYKIAYGAYSEKGIGKDSH